MLKVSSKLPPPSAEQTAAIATAAALKVITTDPNRIPTERRAREMAVRDGTTLEANLFLNGHVKGNVPLEELDKTMGWAPGTMSQWKAGRWENRAGEDEYSAMWRYGKSHNMTTTQLEESVGFIPGTLNNWAQKTVSYPPSKATTQRQHRLRAKSKTKKQNRQVWNENIWQNKSSIK